MMHLFINASAASAGGGLTYIRNVVPHLASRTDLRATILLSPELRREFQETENLRLLQLPGPTYSSLGRTWREQQLVPRMIRETGADLLLSVGNFAVLKSPVPQILLSRNALYVSNDFSRDLIRRRHFRLWLGTKVRARLAKYSVRKADCTIAPSESFARELRNWTGRPIRALHHGFDREQFFTADAPPQDLSRCLERRSNRLRILYVSHYNYYRNFETLFRALPIIRRLLRKDVELVLTCKVEGTPGGYRTTKAVELCHDLGIDSDVLQLGPVPYHQLQHVYRSCDVYVTPAYAETFAHPLVEAMACRLPVVASDLPVHHEICRDAALYFARFSPDDLANRIAHLAANPDLSENLARSGEIRSHDFSWARHVGDILTIARELLETREGAALSSIAQSEMCVASKNQKRYKAV